MEWLDKYKDVPKAQNGFEQPKDNTRISKVPLKNLKEKKRNFRKPATINPQTRSKEAINKASKAAEAFSQKGTPYLQMPLKYLEDPLALLGDLGVDGMPNTDEFVDRVNKARSGVTHETLGGIAKELLPAATLNTALSLIGLPEGAGPLKVANEVFNPLVGMESLTKMVKEIPPSLRSKSIMPSIKDVPLDSKMEPFLSKYVKPISKEEEVYRSSFGLKNYGKKLLEDTVHLDNIGNIIPTPKGYNTLQRFGKELKDGGVVKDDQGYWNPDNHGKVVEINSNNITMEGVDQPLLGISDTGDIKLMQPNENYKFKGNKVTEYPITGKEDWLGKY